MQEKKYNLWKEITMQDLIYESKHGSKLYKNESMDHDDGSNGCMREKDKKIEVLHKKL